MQAATTRRWILTRTTILPAILAVGASTSLLSAQETEKEAFSLLSAVPADVFVVSAGRHNPERDFLTEYWAEVWTAFEESGVAEDLFDLVLSFADEEEREQMTLLCDHFSSLVQAVDSEGLNAGEVVFAERIPGPTMIGDKAVTVIPDIVFLFRTTPEVTDTNFAAMQALLSAAVEMINGASGMELKLAEEEHGDLKSVVFSFSEIDPNAPNLAIALGSMNDVLVMTFGGTIHGDVARLLTGEGESIGDSPRLRAALASLPSAEDGFDFFDTQNLSVGIERALSAILQSIDDQLQPHGEEDESQPTIREAVQAIIDRILGTLGVMEYAATVYHTDGYSVYGDSITVLSPQAESNPIYPVLAGGAPIQDFSRYLPVETVSYAVTGSFDLSALYTFLEGTVRELGDAGEQALAMWEGVQEEHGFDIREDILGWIDGAGVNASFKTEDGPGSISMMKVKDEEQASAKVDWVLETVPKLLEALTAENPMLAMLAMRAEATSQEGLEGFQDVSFGMLPEPMVVGVRDGWLIFGSSADAVLLSQATAAGEHPNVRENEALMARALLPKGPASSVSFTDHSGSAEVAVGVLRGISMGGGMAAAAVPDPDAQKVVMSLCRILGNLAPVVEAIDFFDSSSAVTTFDGKAWRSRTVTHYLAPEKEDGGGR